MIAMVSSPPDVQPEVDEATTYRNLAVRRYSDIAGLRDCEQPMNKNAKCSCCWCIGLHFTTWITCLMDVQRIAKAFQGLAVIQRIYGVKPIPQSFRKYVGTLKE